MAGFLDKEGEPLPVTITVSRSFAEGNGATLQTVIPQTAAQEGINHVVDTLMATIGRMEAHARISAISNDLEANAARIAQNETNLQDLRKRHPDPAKMNTPDRAAVQSVENTIVLNQKLTASLTDERQRLIESLK